MGYLLFFLTLLPLISFLLIVLVNIPDISSLLFVHLTSLTSASFCLFYLTSLTSVSFCLSSNIPNISSLLFVLPNIPDISFLFLVRYNTPDISSLLLVHLTSLTSASLCLFDLISLTSDSFCVLIHGCWHAFKRTYSRFKHAWIVINETFQNKYCVHPNATWLTDRCCQFQIPCPVATFVVCYHVCIPNILVQYLWFQNWLLFSFGRLWTQLLWLATTMLDQEHSFWSVVKRPLSGLAAHCRIWGYLLQLASSWRFVFENFLQLSTTRNW